MKRSRTLTGLLLCLLAGSAFVFIREAKASFSVDNIFDPSAVTSALENLPPAPEALQNKPLPAPVAPAAAAPAPSGNSETFTALVYSNFAHTVRSVHDFLSASILGTIRGFFSSPSSAPAVPAVPPAAPAPVPPAKKPVTIEPPASSDTVIRVLPAATPLVAEPSSASVLAKISALSAKIDGFQNQLGAMTLVNSQTTQSIFQVMGQSAVSSSFVTDLLTDGNIPDGITASNYLPLAGGTITGDLTVTGTCTGCGSGSGNPGGSDTKIQYNNGGSFDGRSLFTFSNTTGNVTLGGDLFVNGGDFNIGNGVSATSTLSGQYGRLGFGTTTPFGQVAIESVQGVAGSNTPIFVIGDQGTSTPIVYVSGNNGYVGIGTDNPTSPFNVIANVDMNTVTDISQVNSDSTAVDNKALRGTSSFINLVGSAAAPSAQTIAIDGEGSYSGTGKIGYALGFEGAGIAYSGTIINAAGFATEGNFNTGGTIQNTYGVWILNNGGGAGAMDNSVGLQVENQTGATNNWNIYSGVATSSLSATAVQYVTSSAKNVFILKDPTESAGGTAIQGVLQTNTTNDGEASVYGYAESTNGAGTTKPTLIGIGADVYHTGAGTITDFVVVNAYLQNKGTGVVNNAYGVNVGVFDNPGTAHTNRVFGIYSAGQTIGSFNNYGLYAGEMASSTCAACDYAIYTAGTAPSFFGGALSVGGHDINLGNGISATSTLSSQYGRLGLGSSTPYAQFGIESVQGVTGSSTPIFVIGDTGTSTLFGINWAGVVGIGTATDNGAESLNGNGFAVATNTVIAGNLSLTGNIDIQGSCTGCATVGGNTTQVQYNNGGSVDGRSLFTFDNSTGNVVAGGSLSLGGASTQGTINLGNGITATSTISAHYGRLGIGTTTPYAQVAIEAVQAVAGSSTPIFVVGDAGSSTFLGINWAGVVGIGTNTDSGAESLNGIGFAVATNTLLAGNVTITSGSLLDVQSTATSTFDGGITVQTSGGLSSASGITLSGGDLLASGAGKITITSTTATNTLPVVSASTLNVSLDTQLQGKLTVTSSATSTITTASHTNLAVTSINISGAFRSDTTGTSTFAGPVSGTGINGTSLNLTGDLLSNAKIQTTSSATNTLPSLSATTINTTGINISGALRVDSTGTSTFAGGIAGTSLSASAGVTISAGDLLFTGPGKISASGSGTSTLPQLNSSFISTQAIFATNTALSLGSTLQNTTVTGTLLFHSGNAIEFGTTTDASGIVASQSNYVTIAATSTIANALTVRGFGAVNGGNYTGNLFQAQNSGGSNLDVINNLGNVGIGSTTPVGAILALTVASTVPAVQINQTGTGNAIDISNSTSHLFVVQSGGNAGVGTSTLGNKLEIAGGGVFKGDLAVEGTARATKLVATSTLGVGTTTLGADQIFSFDLPAQSTEAAAFLIGDAGTATPIFGINSGGQIMIGTNTPAALVAVTNTNYNTIPSVMISGTGSNDGAIALSLLGTCKDNVTTSAGSCDINDLAELFPVSDAVERGDIVMFDSSTPVHLKKATGDQREKLAGVISTSPAIVFEGSKINFMSGSYTTWPDGKAPLAVGGRIPVKISLENGPIMIGDPITISPTLPGVGVKAIESGRIVGYALEDLAEDPAGAEGPAKIMILANEGYWQNPAESAPRMLDVIIEKVADWLKTALVTVQEIFAKKITTDTLCVGSTCVNEEQLKALLNAAQLAPVPAPTLTTPSDPAPISSTTPDSITPITEITPPANTDTVPTDEIHDQQ